MRFPDADSYEESRVKIYGEISTAKDNKLRLYLCGIAHGFNLISLNEIVRLIEPDVVLLEGDDTSATYSCGIAHGEYVKELKEQPDIVLPSLWSIKDAVDEIQCVVRGAEFSHDERVRIAQRRFRITNSRAGRLNDILETRIDKALVNGAKLSISEYHRLEELKDKLYGIPIEDPTTGGLLSWAEEVDNVISGFKVSIHSIGSAVQDLQVFSRNCREFQVFRDEKMFETIRSEYETGRSVLLFVGYAHLRDDSFIVRQLKEERMPSVIFKNC